MIISSAIYLRLGTSALAACLALPATAHAQARSVAMTIPAQDLGGALKAIAAASGEQIIFRGEVVRGKRSNAVQGSYSAERAIAIAIEGKGLSIARSPRGIIMVVARAASLATPAASDASSDEPVPVVEEIIVTGSRIKGAEPVAPVTAATREKIEALGVTDLGSYVRLLPQNYSGGQNPGVISSIQTGSENTTASSALNLRGLGADATLTLLNGHRLAYDAVGQGVDISMIPMVAIERVEVVADGSSALYGSDAVGGVANIILRKDYDGLLTSARFGASTEGGNFQQQYSAVAGKRWDGGGMMIAGDFNKSSDVTAKDRAYTANMQPGFTLIPAMKQISAVAAGHQSIGDVLLFEVDAQYSKREARAALPNLATSDVTVAGTLSRPDIEAWSVSPALRLMLPGSWEVTMRATRAISDAGVGVQIYTGGNLFATNDVSYRNDLWSAEVGAEGPLFRLPGGDARLAVGGGIRSNGIKASIRQQLATSSRTLLNYHDSANIRFGYGEFGLPIVGPGNSSPLLRKLFLSGAVRYEDYDGLGGVATPKLGVVYQPVADLTLKASWGKSFKAPRLAQLNQAPEAILGIASRYLPAAPDSRPIMLLSGGNPDLEPERARTWTATAVLTPSSVIGLRAEISYFNVRYRDRVVRPISDSLQAFSPIYADLVLLNPTREQVLAAIANAPLGLNNQTGAAFDPSSVGAIIMNRFQNAAAQRIEGVDATISYDFSVGRNELSLNGAASYLESDQQLSANQPVIERAGTIFNPPHWRGRADMQWTRGNVTLTAAYNYVGGTEDRRTATIYKVKPFHAFDLTARLKTGDGGFLPNLSILLAVQNILDRKPSMIRTTSNSNPTYDATNYPSNGRLLGITVQKQW